MLEMKHTDNKAAVKEYCEKYGILYSDKYEAYKAEITGQVIGAGIFYITGSCLRIVALKADDMADTPLLEGIFRAVLNYGSNYGAENYGVAEEISKETIAILTEIGIDISVKSNIEEFFTGGRCC